MISYKSAFSFKRMIDAINVLVSEGTFIFSRDGLRFRSTDPSVISMVDFFLPKEKFESYKVDNEMKIGLDLDYFSKILSRARKEDKLEFEISDATLKTVFKGKTKRSFSIPLLDLEYKELPIPKIEYNAELVLASKEINEFLKDAEIISTFIVFNVSPSKIFLSSSSSRGDFNHEIPKDSEIIKEFKVEKPTKSIFSIVYLKDIFKFAMGGVKLFVGTDVPIKVSYKVEDADLTYLVSPRAEE